MHLPEDKIRLRAYWISLFVSFGLLAMKYTAYTITQSQAVLSDALESIVNVLTPIVGLIVLNISAKPADKDHPYGHGKVEYFSAAFEGGFVFFAAVLIVYRAIKTFLIGHEIHELDSGLLIVTAAGAINLVLGLFVLGVGKKHYSSALVANGKHILSDVWTTLAVLVGLLLVRLTGLPWIDSVTAALMGLWLAYESYKLIRGSIGGLLDEVDAGLIWKISDLFTKHRRPGIIHIHAVRMIRAGRYHHIDAHVVVPEYWDVTTTHEQTDRFERDVINDYPVNGEVHFHIDPCRRAYCSACSVYDCKIRQGEFAKEIPFSIASLISPQEPAEFRKK